MKKNRYLIVEQKALNAAYLEDLESLEAAKKQAAEMTENMQKVFVIVKVIEIVIPPAPKKNK